MAVAQHDAPADTKKHVHERRTVAYVSMRPDATCGSRTCACVRVLNSEILDYYVCVCACVLNSEILNYYVRVCCVDAMQCCVMDVPSGVVCDVAWGVCDFLRGST